MAERLRILAVTPYYDPEGGGLERYAHAILARLAARGHQARAVAFTRGAPGLSRRDGVDVQRVRPALRISNTPVHPGFVRVVGEALRDRRPDVVWVHTPVPFPAEMAAIAARRAGVPWVVTYHAGRLEGGSPLLDAFAALDRATLERGMLAGAAGLVAVSPFVRRGALAAHAARAEVIPPGVDHRVFRPAEAAAAGRGHGAEGPAILFAGPLDRAYRWKGVDVLWAAFREVRAAVPGARLVLVGDGDRRAELQARAQREGIAGAVELPGRLPLGELVARMQAAAVGVLPSTSPAESFGMVLAEANACGRPVVGSRIGGIPDFVRHGENGLLAAPGDASDLAARIVELLRDPARAARMGAAGRARVLAEHRWEDLAARTEAVLARAAGKAQHPAARAAPVGPLR